MLNPRFVKVSPDDTLWFYETSTSDLGALADPLKYFSTIVYNRAGCPKPKEVELKRAKFAPGETMMQFAGICGTPLIIVSGFSGPLLEAFLSWRLARGIPKRIDSEEWSRFIAESAHGRSLEPLAGSRLDYAMTVAANFWTDCEAMMSAMPGRKGDIEFLIFPDQKQLYVHLELGPLTDFASDFYDALADRDGFVDWLLHGTIIPRRVYEVQMDGSKLEVTTLPADKIVLDVSSFDKEMFQTEPPCSSGCSPFVCSMLAATLMNYDKTHGVASAGLEEVVIKIYCVDAQGKPCP